MTKNPTSEPHSQRPHFRSSCKKIFRTSSARDTPRRSLCCKAPVWNSTARATSNGSHIFFPTAWCGFPAKINTNLHIVHAASHARCQQHFVWFLNVFTSSLQFMLSVLPEMISFSFCPISTFLISLLSLWLLFVYICLKFPLPLTTYRLNSLPRQFCSAVNGGPVSILKQKAVF